MSSVSSFCSNDGCLKLVGKTFVQHQIATWAVNNKKKCLLVYQLILTLPPAPPALTDHYAFRIVTAGTASGLPFALFDDPRMTLEQRTLVVAGIRTILLWSL